MRDSLSYLDNLLVTVVSKSNQADAFYAES